MLLRVLAHVPVFVHVRGFIVYLCTFYLMIVCVLKGEKKLALDTNTSTYTPTVTNACANARTPLHTHTDTHAPFNSYSNLHPQGIGLIDGLAYDWVGKNVYWADYNLEHIAVANIDGDVRHRSILFKVNVTNPRGMAIDSRYSVTSRTYINNIKCPRGMAIDSRYSVTSRT